MSKGAVFSKSSDVDGVWVKLGLGDVHVYRCHASKAMVLGHNASEKVSYPDAALVLNEDGGIHVQKVNAEGQPYHTDIDPDMFAERLAAFIAQF